MKKTSSKPPRLFVRLIGVVMLSLVFLIANAQAQVDSDNDGFLNLNENAGFTLFNGGTIFPPCLATALATDPCVHPLSPDLFIILVPAATGSLLPSGPLNVLPNLLPGFGVHQITSAQASQDRLVTSVSPQKAVRITESLDTNDVIWGRSLFQGNPNSAGDATVFTQRIRNRIIGAYQEAGVVNAAAQQADIDKCIRHTIAHEAGHNTAIASQYNSRYGGNHYSASSQVVMSQNATITVKGGRVTVVCPQAYASPDATGFRLK